MKLQTMNKLDKDLFELSKSATSQYQSERGIGQGSAQVWLIQEIRNLRNTIMKLDKQNLKLNNAILLLTYATVFLAVVQIILQIY